MTGFESKRNAARDKLDEVADTLNVVYQSGFADGKAAANAMHELAKLGQEIEQEPVAKLFGTLPVFDTPPAAQRPWVGLTDEEIHKTTVLMGFNPEWKTEIGMAHAIVRNLEAKLKTKNDH